MKKKLLSLLLTVFITQIPITFAEDSTYIKLGDYVQMGVYDGEPMLWRCVSFEKIIGYDDNGNPIMDSTDTVTEYKDGYLPLMYSDKIICFKSFDASGENTEKSHGRGLGYRIESGSNYWGDSNIRDWLNSQSVAGNIIWSCGNPPSEDYVNEAGFLTNFLSNELTAIQSVNQKSMLFKNEYYKMDLYGDTYLRYSSAIDSILKNYDTAYSERIVDKIFFPDILQIKNIYNNSSTLGEEYYIGEATEETATNSNYTTTIDNQYPCWLRTPDTNNHSVSITSLATNVSCIMYEGIYESHACKKSGIRPSFFLKKEKYIDFNTGSGLKDDPYKDISAKLSNECNITKIYSELNYTINNNTISYIVPNQLEQFKPSFQISDGAIWNLYYTPTANVPIDNRTFSIQEGKSNNVYLRITAEDGITTKTYILSVYRNTKSSPPKIVASSNNITIKTNNSSTILYTLDGSIPEANNGFVYNGSFTVDYGTTITAVAKEPDKDEYSEPVTLHIPSPSIATIEQLYFDKISDNSSEYSVYLASSNEVNLQGDLYIAFYNDEGTILSLEKQHIDSDSIEEQISGTIRHSNTATNYKIFFWENNSIRPISNSISGNL